MTRIKWFYFFLRQIFWQRFAIRQLVRRDLQSKYLASYLGIPWAFIQPAVMVLVMWFAFTYGLKLTKIEGEFPFALWLICGLVPWLFMSEVIQSSSNSLIEYSYLIRKTDFRTGIIPLIKLFSTSVIHLFFLFVIMVLCIFYGYPPNIYWIQIPYYILAVFILLSGIVWLGAALNVFVRDIGPAINVFISIMFWVTPIIWPYSMLEGKFKYVALLNPFFYITEGYRNIFLQKVWFFETMPITLYYWSVSLVVFSLGAFVFQKLKPHFADVL